MKLAILGGGGARMPALVHTLLSAEQPIFDQIVLVEGDPHRRATIGRLAVEVAAALGASGAVSLAGDDAETALSGADFVFSAIRVGGDAGRVIDEQVPLGHGLVAQETTGAGGFAMALRTIPVVLGYCRLIEELAPRAVLVNFTNPAGIVTEAVRRHSRVDAVGVCDTPSALLGHLERFVVGGSPKSSGGAGDPRPSGTVEWSYSGLNHLGWVTSLRVGGEERIGELVEHYERMQLLDASFAAHDPALVRRIGAVPSEYLYYFYDAARAVESLRLAGSTRGSDVAALNGELLTMLGRRLDAGDLAGAWAGYTRLMAVRSDTYLRSETAGDSGQRSARSARQHEPDRGVGERRIGGYEGVALDLVEALVGRRPATVVLNTANHDAMGFLDQDDVVEVPCRVSRDGVETLVTAPLPDSARGLVTEVKAYERAVVDAAVAGDAGLAAVALALHPLVPGITMARRIVAEYRERHGATLAYLD